MTSGGLRTSVKGYLIAQCVTLAPEINTVHDDEMSIYVTSDSTDADSVNHLPPASYGLNICDGNIPCLPMLSSAAKSMASYGARTKSESLPHNEVEILQSFHLRRFHFNELKAATTNFPPHSILGQGAFGSVYKGWIDEHSFTAAKPGTGIAIAIKRLNQHRTLQNHKDWLMEVSCLGQLDHPNLVKLIGYCLEDGMRLLVHEFIPQGSLNMHLRKRASQFPLLPWNVRMKIALDAAKGLAFLHSDEVKMIYGDFETSKILLDSMTIPWKDQSTPKSDVYSFGVVVLEILSGRRAFDNYGHWRGKSLVQLAKNMSMSVELASKHKVNQFCDAQLQGRYSQNDALKALNLASQCLSIEPMSRPSMNEVVEVLEQLQSGK